MSEVRSPVRHSKVPVRVGDEEWMREHRSRSGHVGWDEAHCSGIGITVRVHVLWASLKIFVGKMQLARFTPFRRAKVENRATQRSHCCSHQANTRHCRGFSPNCVKGSVCWSSWTTSAHYNVRESMRGPWFCQGGVVVPGRNLGSSRQDPSVEPGRSGTSRLPQVVGEAVLSDPRAVVWPIS